MGLGGADERRERCGGRRGSSVNSAPAQQEVRVLLVSDGSTDSDMCPPLDPFSSRGPALRRHLDRRRTVHRHTPLDGVHGVPARPTIHACSVTSCCSPSPTTPATRPSSRSWTNSGPCPHASPPSAPTRWAATPAWPTATPTCRRSPTSTTWRATWSTATTGAPGRHRHLHPPGPGRPVGHPVRDLTGRRGREPWASGCASTPTSASAQASAWRTPRLRSGSTTTSWPSRWPGVAALRRGAAHGSAALPVGGHPAHRRLGRRGLSPSPGALTRGKTRGPVDPGSAAQQAAGVGVERSPQGGIAVGALVPAGEVGAADHAVGPQGGASVASTPGSLTWASHQRRPSRSSRAPGGRSSSGTTVGWWPAGLADPRHQRSPAVGDAHVERRVAVEHAAEAPGSPRPASPRRRTRATGRRRSGAARGRASGRRCRRAPGGRRAGRRARRRSRTRRRSGVVERSPTEVGADVGAEQPELAHRPAQLRRRGRPGPASGAGPSPPAGPGGGATSAASASLWRRQKVDRDVGADVVEERERVGREDLQVDAELVHGGQTEVEVHERRCPGSARRSARSRRRGSRGSAGRRVALVELGSVGPGRAERRLEHDVGVEVDHGGVTQGTAPGSDPSSPGRSSGPAAGGRRGRAGRRRRAAPGRRPAPGRRGGRRRRRRPRRVDARRQVLADAGVHAEAEAQPPRGHAAGSTRWGRRRRRASPNTAGSRLAAIRSITTLPPRGHLAPVRELDVRQRPAHGDRARRLQADGLVHAALQEGQVGAGPLEVVGAVVGQLEDVVQRPDERGGARCGRRRAGRSTISRSTTSGGQVRGRPRCAAAW